MDIIVSFDCYGTIIDWETGILNAVGQFLNKYGKEMNKERILSLYAEIESELEKEYKPYKEILREIALRFANKLQIELSRNDEDILVRTLPEWPPFPDSRDALLKIKKNYKIAIISNIDNDLIQKTIEKLKVDFDYIVTAEMVEAYKPSIKVFERAYEIFNIPKSQWIHVGQSIYHDIIPAKNFGIKAILIKRRGYGATPKVEGKPDLIFNDLKDFAEFIDRGSLENFLK